MTAHLNDDQIARYQQGQLSAAEFATLDAHIQGCRRCAERLLTSQEKRNATMMLLSEWGDPPGHLSYEMLKEYADQQASEETRRAVEGHISFCSRCREDLRNLREFRAEMPEQVRALNRMAAEMASTAPARTNPWRIPFWVGSGAVFGAMATCLLLWIAVLQPHSGNIDRLTQARPQGIENAANTVPIAQLDQLESQLALLQQEQAAHRQQTQDQLREQQKKIGDLVAKIAVLNSRNSALNRQNRKLLANRQHAATPSEDQKTERLVADNWNAGTIPLRVSRVLGQANGPLIRGGLTPLEPVQSTVLADKPTLRWSGISYAKAYEIEVYLLQGDRPQSMPIAHGSVDADHTSWRVDVPLERQHDYEWRLDAVIAGGRREKAEAKPRFHIASTAEQQRYVHAWQQEAILAAQDGLYEEALAALDKIIEVNPDPKTTAHARQMRASLQKQHGVEE